MTSLFDVTDGKYVVLINEGRQHSLWPDRVDVPAGWSVVCGPTERETCLDYVNAEWLNLRPASLAEELDALDPGAPGPVTTDLIPLSFNQDFLCTFDEGDTEGAFGHRHILVAGWLVRGPVDEHALRAALADVVARHESLRTEIARHAEARYQVIRRPAPVRLEVRDLSGVAVDGRSHAAEELLNEVDATPFPVAELPLLRCVLGRFDDRESVLVLSTHHTATDAWSMEILMRDTAVCYAARVGDDAPELPEVVQYQRHARAQQAGDGIPVGAPEYWREKLRDAAILAVPKDVLPTEGEEPVAETVYAVHRFLLPADLTAATLAFAKTLRASPFIVLLAAYHVLLHERSGRTDLVVPTFTSGRYSDEFVDTVGMFVNFLPLRTEIDGCATFREIAERCRVTCVEAYRHDMPFVRVVGEAPGVVAPYQDERLAVIAFEVLQAPPLLTEPIGGLTYTPIRRRLLSQTAASGIPNGLLWAMDVLPTGEVAGSLKYNPAQFEERTVAGLVERYRDLLAAGVAAPDRPLRLRTDTEGIAPR